MPDLNSPSSSPSHSASLPSGTPQILPTQVELPEPEPMATEPESAPAPEEPEPEPKTEDAIEEEEEEPPEPAAAEPAAERMEEDSDDSLPLARLNVPKAPSREEVEAERDERPVAKQIGRRIKVWWDGPCQYFEGVVANVPPHEGPLPDGFAYIRYDDGDKRTHDLREGTSEIFEWCSDPPPNLNFQ